jgi:hypothetical protein
MLIKYTLIFKKLFLSSSATRQIFNNRGYYRLLNKNHVAYGVEQDLGMPFGGIIMQFGCD